MTVIIVLLAIATLAPGAGAAERGTIATVLHVHSTHSTGTMSLDELAEFARRNRLGAVLLSENYLLRVEYGLPPFRALTRVTYSGGRDVLTTGLDRYLAAVAAAQQRHADVVFVPGVEVMPHYHWSGSPVGLEMTLANTQKNVLVFGVRDPAALARLPAIGNGAAAVYDWQSLVDAVPVLCLVPGVLLIARKQTRRMRVGRAAVVLVRRRRWRLGAVLAAIGVAALIRGWPFTVDRYPSWSDPGLAPYQDLIDHVEGAGGIAVWSFPEARDDGEHVFGPVRVKRRTDPYPDDLLRSVRYTAFGAIYEDTTRFERSGAGWDRLLAQHVAGERSRPVWAIAESGFHETGATKRLGLVQTVLLDAERSEAGVLDALRRGRLYALRRTPERALELAEFSIAVGTEATMIAHTTRVPAGGEVDVRIGVTASDGGSHPVRVTLVRNGKAVAAWTERTPFRTVHRETVPPGRGFYRLDVRGDRPHSLLTNPIFVDAS